MDYFTETGGKVFPGCTIVLMAKNNEELLNMRETFADLKEGLNKAVAKTLQAKLNTGDPVQVGETYKL